MLEVFCEISFDADGFWPFNLFWRPDSLPAPRFPTHPASRQPLPRRSKATSESTAGGCFWGMEGIYEHVKGVTDTQVGYAGGSAKTAHYERIEQGDTGHAESIRITYDPEKISYGQLLKIYFSVAHDPDHSESSTQRRGDAIPVVDFLSE